ncbi:MAG: D-alanyl-D-alanine carboxypeptidase [Opitutae bacterium]|nr:D-alanyl-D-alanine carboxypeptidase [Opitutae bacterium]
MKHFRWLAVFSLLALVPQLAARKKAEAPVRGAGSYTGAITIDADSGQVLFEDHADEQSPPASMTKLMTFAVLHDKLADGSLTLPTPVKIDASDAKMGGTQVYLDPRETFPVEELIYAMMIQSANDAAHALARTAAGSVDAFVELMNAKARALGMTHTTFRSPHGLPPPSRRVADGDLTTPRDFAVLCRYLVQHTDVLKYTAVKDRAFGTARAQGSMQMTNHNKLLGRVAGVDGLKTGYTESAGYCLSATAQRNGRRVIGVVMGAFGPNRSIDKGKFRDLKAIDMLERGFAALPARVANPNAAPAAEAPMPTVKTTPVAAPAAETIPTVKTAAPAATGQTSTASDMTVTFRVIPPAKKP